jgi:hypothetical protein
MNGQETARIDCPYCGEQIDILIDGSVSEQEYVEDCQVCCRPILLQITVGGDGTPSVSVRREDD